MSAGFRYIAWARGAAQRCANRSDAHVLLVLATYANARGEAWPTRATIAKDCGLAVKGDGTQGASSSVAESLRRLRDAGLIDSVQRGKGRSAKHRLLADSLQSARPDSELPVLQRYTSALVNPDLLLSRKLVNQLLEEQSATPDCMGQARVAA